MYQYIDGACALSINDWIAAGLTYNQFKNDSKRGFLQIAQRSINGETLIWVDSIRRADRLRLIELAYGKAKDTNTDIYAVVMDVAARQFYTTYQHADGTPLDAAHVNEYVAKASLFTVMAKGLQTQRMARAKSGSRLIMKEWYQSMLVWYTQQCLDQHSIAYGLNPYTNVRSFERAFQSYCNGGYSSLIHSGIGNDNARKVCKKLENLLLALYRTEDHPFVSRVLELYTEFISGKKELYDQSTGEVFRPRDFIKPGSETLSESTVWNYLKDVYGNTAIYADRNGNFEYNNSLRPKNHRHHGTYSLSKISMDDVALSRKAVGNKWVYKYMATDVVSQYIFRPAYILGKPTEQTVYESFRNMFCELSLMGLPMPGELEVEHHIMSNFQWLPQVFQFVRFCQSPTEKRAEHAIRRLKYGAAKDLGQTRGRWYAKHEAYKSVRFKINGDYPEQEFDPHQLIADDMAAIEAHNNELHPDQKRFPGKTRKQVLMENFNPNLQAIDKSYLYRFIGNKTDTSIRNNDYCQVACQRFELKDFACLQRLKPNNRTVTAYWLPDEEGNVNTVYLYQGETYIGEAENLENFTYNECAAERTAEDEAKMLHQAKRAAKFDRLIKERRQEIPRIGKINSDTARYIETVPVDIVIEENEQPVNYDGDEFADYAKQAINSL